MNKILHFHLLEFPGPETEVSLIGSIDLEVQGGWDAAIELKFPRDPRGSGAADTMTLGELLKDFFKVAYSDRSIAVVLQLTGDRLRRYLERRPSSEPLWTFEPGRMVELTPEAIAALPKTARDTTMGPFSQRGTVQGHCVFAEDIGTWKLVVYEVTSQNAAAEQ